MKDKKKVYKFRLHLPKSRPVPKRSRVLGRRRERGLNKIRFFCFVTFEQHHLKVRLLWGGSARALPAGTDQELQLHQPSGLGLVGWLVGRIPKLIAWPGSIEWMGLRFGQFMLECFNCFQISSIFSNTWSQVHFIFRQRVKVRRH